MSEELSHESGRKAEDEQTSTPEGNKESRKSLKRTPFSKSKGVHSHFKSPLQVSESARISAAEEAAELQRRRAQLDAEISQLEAEGYSVEELDRHIDMLHEYNDIKDVGQTLLGRIAALRGTTTRDLYAHFGLDLDD
ncbi:unnamed protein product [Ophioblennius macclurei]